jgi:hypothetical protein
MMPLVDRTNETIPLTLEVSPEPDEVATLNVDADSDSSFDPSEWVWLSFYSGDEASYRLTYQEAELLHDRLGRVLGEVQNV